MLFIYFHLIRGFWLITKLFNYNINLIWIIGLIIFVSSLIEGFFGYILNWGQISYWGITVMINILSIIPIFGNIIGRLIWCNSLIII